MRTCENDDDYENERAELHLYKRVEFRCVSFFETLIARDYEHRRIEIVKVHRSNFNTKNRNCEEILDTSKSSNMSNHCIVIDRIFRL